jgi:hypothetical protein
MPARGRRLADKNLLAFMNCYERFTLRKQQVNAVIYAKL